MIETFAIRVRLPKAAPVPHHRENRRLSKQGLIPMLSVDAKGVFPIAPTPFLADGGIDAASVDAASMDRTHNERQFWRARNAAGDETDRFLMIELRRQSVLRHAEARGLSGPGKDFVSSAI
jgi:hypothetical protein